MRERERDPEAQRKSSQRRGAEYTKRLRQRAGTEITGKDKRWIRMARKYPRGEGYKGGRNKSQCRRANLRVLQSTMSRAEESRPLTLTCPERLCGGLGSFSVPQPVLSGALKWSTSGMKSYLWKKWKKGLYIIPLPQVNCFLGEIWHLPYCRTFDVWGRNFVCQKRRCSWVQRC